MIIKRNKTIRCRETCKAHYVTIYDFIKGVNSVFFITAFERDINIFS